LTGADPGMAAARRKTRVNALRPGMTSLKTIGNRSGYAG
jgi:hypothetical protein